METNEERREVARKLREEADTFHALNPFKAIKDSIWPDGGNHSDVEWIRRLADLIEPDTTTDTTKDVPVSPIASPIVDRDALIGLAEEMEMHAQGECDEGDGRINAGYLWAYADRIRDALGVSYDG